MRHSLRFATALYFAPFLLLAVGCSSLTETTNESGDTASTVSRAGLEMSVAVVREEVAPSAEVTVRVALTNTARTPAQISLSCTSLLRHLGIRGIEQVTLLYLNQRGCYTALTNLTLASGEARTVDVVLGAVDARDFARPRPLPPGRYVVDAQPSLREVNGSSIELPALQAGFTVR